MGAYGLCLVGAHQHARPHSTGPPSEQQNPGPAAMYFVMLKRLFGHVTSVSKLPHTLWVRMASAWSHPTSMPGPTVQGPPVNRRMRAPLPERQASSRPHAALAAAPVARARLCPGGSSASSGCMHALSALWRQAAYNKSRCLGQLPKRQASSKPQTALAAAPVARARLCPGGSSASSGYMHRPSAFLYRVLHGAVGVWHAQCS